MKIGIMSDSHDNVTAVRKAVALFEHEGVDAIIHAGDFVAPFSAKALLEANTDIWAVFGNCDGEKEGLRNVIPHIEPPPFTTRLDGTTITITHNLPATAKAIPNDASVIIHGHTHMREISNDAGRLIVNPGETCGMVSGLATVAILDMDTMDCQIVELE